MTDAGERRPAIDVARSVALLVVVFGHLLLAVVDQVGDEVRGANLLALHPAWTWLAVLAPMPIFFAAAGWANATSRFDAAIPRLRPLIGLGAVVVGVWAVAVIAAVATTGDAGVVGDGARIGTQPLWFLAAYVPFAAAARPLARAADRALAITIGGLLVVAALDLARFAFDAPEWIGWLAFPIVWGVPWVLGSWWRARASTPGFDERRAGVQLAVVAAVGAGALLAAGGYRPELIDVLDGARSNTTPPNLYTAAAGLVQVGVLMVLARALDGLGRRWPGAWARIGAVAVPVYAWHLTALALVAALVAAGMPVPARDTLTFWLTRPLWIAAVLAVTAGLVIASGWCRERLAGRHRGAPRREPARALAIAGVVLTSSSAAFVGLRGPTSGARALVCLAGFALAWACVRPHAQRSGVVASGP